MAKIADVRVYVLIGENGDYTIAKDRMDLHDLYMHEHGSLPPATRTVAIAMSVARPRDAHVSAIVGEEHAKVEVDVS